MQKKKTFFKDKMVLRVVFFYKKVNTNWYVRLEKHQTIESLLMVDFLRISKNVTYFKFF